MAGAQSQDLSVCVWLAGEISYQHPWENNRLEFGLGFHQEVAYLSGAYEWMFDLPTEGLKWYLEQALKLAFVGWLLKFGWFRFNWY